MVRFPGQWGVKGHKVTLLQQIVKILVLDPPGLFDDRLLVWIIGHHFHLETAASSHHGLANSAKTDDPQDLGLIGTAGADIQSPNGLPSRSLHCPDCIN